MFFSTFRPLYCEARHAVLHHDGIVLGTLAIPDKSNEIPSVKPLLEPLSIEGDTVTLDALHTQRATAEFIVRDKHADYVMTVKDNQEGLLDKLSALPDESFSPSTNNN